MLSSLGLPFSVAGSEAERLPLVAAVRRDTAWLAGRPTRVVGSADHDRTLGELVQALKAEAARSKRVTLWTQSFPVFVPRVFEASLTISDGPARGRHRVYPLWPASVRLHTTPSDGIAGRLVYIGEGRPGKPPGRLSARSLRGQIAVMEVTGGARWKNAYNAGARAILLLGAKREDNRHLHTHLVPIPINVPRFYVPAGALADRLRAGVGAGRLIARAEWAQVSATNLYALVMPESPSKKKALAVGVRFDSAGVVPGLAPGADDAVDVALALNALRHFARTPPARPLFFAFADAYGINQLGLRRMLIALAADPTSDETSATRAADLARARQYGEHAELAREIRGDRESLRRLHEARYRPLHLYIKDEVSSVSVRLEHEIHPRRLKKHALLRRQTRLALREPDLSALDARLETLEAEIERLKRERDAANAAERQLITDRPLPEDAAGLRLAQTLWRRAADRIFAQLADVAGVIETRLRWHRLRSEVLRALGRSDEEAADNAPLAFLLGLDLSDAGVAAGPCLRGGYLNVSESQNAESFSQWLKELERDRGDAVWTGAAARAVDLSPVTGSDSADSFSVGRLALFTSPAWSFGLPAATWTTLDAPRPRVDTPSDSVAFLNWARLEPQIDATWAMIQKLAGDTDFEPTTKAHARWHRVQGTIVDQAPGAPVPRLPMEDYLVTLVSGWVSGDSARAGYSPVPGVRRQELCRTGADGRFLYEAIAGRTGVRHFFVQAVKLKPDGRIERAVDMRKQGKGVGLTVDVGARSARPVRALVFSCEELTLAGLFDPRFLINLPSSTMMDAQRGSRPQRLNLLSYNDLVSAQLEPDTYWQAAFRVGITGNRMALLNMEEPEPGTDARDLMHGFPVGEPLPEHPQLIAARDFFRLDRKRLDDYERAGIVNKAPRRLQEHTRAKLEQAAGAKKTDDGAALTEAANGALANEVRAYKAVQDTAQDVIRGAIFLLLMLIPFAYAVERLVFASAGIYRQIGMLLAVFVVMSFVLWNYHPAFEISGQPMMIVMAFAVIFMSLMVISVVLSKFESGLKELQSGRAERSGARTSRLGLMTTALRLGIANMRRRRFRTILTGTTVVLITFAMLCFMSTSSYIGHREFRVADRAPYTGVLIRQPGSRAMPRAALFQLASVVGGGRPVVPRYWWNSQSNKYWRIHVRNPATGAVASVKAALGLAPEEGRLTGMEKTCPDWARFSERGGCYLPEGVARKLGVAPGARVVIAGEELELVGVLHTAGMAEQRTLDGESILPLDYTGLEEEDRRRITDTSIERLALELQTGTSLEPDQQLARVAPDDLIVLPADLLAGVAGTTLRSIAVPVGAPDEAHALARELAGRLAFPVYVGRPAGVDVLAATPLIPRPHKHLVIPVIIAGFIIFNTMLSSIAERKREIYIYTSLGLAPLHVGFLFLAEAATYGLMGSIFGYIVGQGLATVFKDLGWMGGLTLNYSGTQAILTMVLVLMVVVISSLVPAFMAGKLAVPSNEMTWTVPEPVNDVIRDKLPFTVTAKTANGVMAFIHEYLDAHREGSIGNFSTADVRAFRTPSEDGDLIGVEATVWLAPYDLGVRQELRIVAEPAGVDDVYRMWVRLERRSGQQRTWRKLNRVLLADLRRQLLGWRKLKLKRMLEYIAEAKERLAALPAAE
jgi:hypothetical protein